MFFRIDDSEKHPKFIRVIISEQLHNMNKGKQNPNFMNVEEIKLQNFPLRKAKWLGKELGLNRSALLSWSNMQ